MRYFLPELWLDANGRSTTRFSPDQWMINLQAYKIQLEALQPRLGARLYRFFTKISLHDGTLVMLTAGDKIHGRSGKRLRSEPCVVLEVLDAFQDNRYILSYEGIRRFIFDYPTDTPLFRDHDCDPIGDWGYDEITPADSIYLRHEVLFSSGTSLLIEFKKLRYKNVRVKK